MPERLWPHKGQGTVGSLPNTLRDHLWENLPALGDIPRKGEPRKGFVYGIEVGDSQRWVTAANDTRNWNLRVEKKRTSSRRRGDEMTYAKQTYVKSKNLLR